MKKGRVFQPTTVFNKSYLAIAWSNRHQLTDTDRKGFAQFFYLTVSSHVESVLSNTISARLESVAHMTTVNTSASQRDITDGQTIDYSFPLAVLESVRSIATQLSHEAEVASFSNLKTLYKTTFGESLKTLIGKELDLDLEALSSLRNIIAHGRELYIEFERSKTDAGIYTNDLSFNLDKNPLQKPASRLREAKIMQLKISDITAENWSDFLSKFYSDEALLYFYKSAVQLDIRLEEFHKGFPEEFYRMALPLPNLEE